MALRSGSILPLRAFASIPCASSKSPLFDKLDRLPYYIDIVNILAPEARKENMATRTSRPDIQALYDHALSFVPASGEIDYATLHANILASENPQAVNMLPELKKRGAVVARIEVVDGVKTHTYRRSGGG